MIVEAREAGLSVADLKLLFDHMETGGDGSFDAGAFFDGKIAEMERVIARSGRFLALLRQMRAALVLAAQDEPQAAGAGRGMRKGGALHTTAKN